VRRIVFGLTVSFMKTSVYYQLGLTAVASMVLLGWNVRVMPFQSTFLNVVYIVNELFFFQLVYLSLLMTPFVPEVEDRYTFGYLYLGVVAFNIVMNFSALMWLLVKEIQKYMKKRKYEKAVVA